VPSLKKPLLYPGGGGGIAAVTGTSPISVVTTTGTAAVSIATAGTSTVGAVQLTDSANSTSTTTAATPNAVFQAKKDMQVSAYNSTTRIGNLPNWFLTSQITITSGQVIHSRHIPERNFTVGNLGFITGTTAASGLTLCRFGIYTRSGTTFTLVARTASDTTLFAAASTRYTRALDTTGGYPATYDFVAGNEYWISAITIGTTMPNIVSAAAATTAVTNAFGNMLYADSGETDLPASSTGVASNNRIYSEVS